MSIQRAVASLLLSLTAFAPVRATDAAAFPALLQGGSFTNLGEAVSNGRATLLLGPGEVPSFSGEITGVGDIDGDGYEDFVITDPFESSLVPSGGVVWLVFGGANFQTFGATFQAPDFDGLAVLEFRGAQAQMRLGAGVAGIGDFLGHDGVYDLAIGAPTYESTTANQTGAVFLIPGSPFIRSLDSPVLLGGGDDSHALVLHPSEPGKLFGETVAPAGDFDNDGRDDILIGAPFHSEGSASLGSNGAVFLLRGASELPSNGTVNVDTLDTDAAIRFFGSANGELVGGKPFCGLGDFNGDGLDDFAIASPFHNDGDGALGRVYVVYGKDSQIPGTRGEGFESFNLGFLGGADGLIIQSTANGFFGASLVPLNAILASNYASFAVSEPNHAVGDDFNNGRVIIIHGQKGLFSGVPLMVEDLIGTAMATTITGDNETRLGASIAPNEAYSEVFGTLQPSIVIGVPGHSGGVTDRSEGRGFSSEGAAANYPPLDIVVRQGPETTFATLTESGAGESFIGANPQDEAGALVGNAGDLDGDGFLDLLIASGIPSGKDLSTVNFHVIRGNPVWHGFNTSYVLISPPETPGFKRPGLRMNGSHSRPSSMFKYRFNSNSPSATPSVETVVIQHFPPAKARGFFPQLPILWYFESTRAGSFELILTPPPFYLDHRDLDAFRIMHIPFKDHAPSGEPVALSTTRIGPNGRAFLTNEAPGTGQYYLLDTNANVLPFELDTIIAQEEEKRLLIVYTREIIEPGLFDIVLSTQETFTPVPEIIEFQGEMRAVALPFGDRTVPTGFSNVHKVFQESSPVSDQGHALENFSRPWVNGTTDLLAMRTRVDSSANGNLGADEGVVVAFTGRVIEANFEDGFFTVSRQTPELRQDVGVRVRIPTSSSRAPIIPTVRAGSDVRISGSLETDPFSGMQVVDAGFSGVDLISGPRAPIIPTVRVIDNIAGGEEFLESTLVRVDRLFVPGRSLGDNQFEAGFTYFFGDGTGFFPVYVTPGTDIPGTQIPQEEFSILAVLQQRDGSPPFDDTYVLAPRTAADIIVGEERAAGWMLYE